METAFGIIAEPNRRAILGLLASSERSVTEIEHRLRDVALVRDVHQHPGQELQRVHGLIYEVTLR